MKNLSKFLLGMVSVAAVGAVAAPASADAYAHPVRHEIKTREHRQLRRIHEERSEGEISTSQAIALRHQDKAIQHQSHVDAHAQDGSLTDAQARHLNGELNTQSRKIGQ